MRFFKNIIRWFFLWLPLWCFGKKIKGRVKTISVQNDEILRNVVDVFFENSEERLNCCIKNWPLVIVQVTAGDDFGSSRYYPPIRCATVVVLYSPNENILTSRFENAIDELLYKVDCSQ